MKILQKRTSRFVASLFNGLGIIACVSVSSCSSKGKNSKGKDTDEFDGLKKKLKEANDNFEQLDFDDQNKIAKWFKNNPSQTNFSLTKDILQQIFIDNNSKLNDVVQKLGIDTDTDAEENKLDSDDLKKKVAQKFIDKEIDINDESAIQKDMSSVLSEVNNEGETKNVTVNIETGGKASIVYSDNTNNFFEFNELSNLQDFVNALADKNVVEVKGGSWFLVLENDKAKVCGHGVGFDYKDNFDDFLSCLDSLVKINGLDFNSFKMTVEETGVSLDGNKLNDDYCKKSDFWNQVKNYPALFGLESNKLQIEKKDLNVKINNFETELQWSDVVEDEKNVNATWKSVFVINGKEAEKKKKEEVDKKTKISYYMINKTAKVGDEEVLLTNLNAKLKSLNSKNVEIADFPKWDTFTDVDKLSSFLDYIKALFEAKVYSKKINITIPQNNHVFFNGVDLKCDVTSVVFWKAIQNHKELFDPKKFFISKHLIDTGVDIRCEKGGNTVTLNKQYATFFESRGVFGSNIKTEYQDFFEKL